jgi:uncharacterized protein (DUF488 family)
MLCDPQSAAGSRLFTVGHSHHEAARLLELLRRAGVTAVADVRSSPYSRRLPQFNRPQLEDFLRRHGLTYLFLGDLLGGRPADRDLYDAEGWVDYERVRHTDPFRRGLDRLVSGLEQYVVVLLCAEDDPLDCHRGLMIAPALVERGLAPLHLRKDGSMETTAEMERRLFRETGVGEGLVEGLFAPMLTASERHELLAEAYRIMNRKKAYRIPEEEG